MSTPDILAFCRGVAKHAPVVVQTITRHRERLETVANGVQALGQFLADFGTPGGSVAPPVTSPKKPPQKAKRGRASKAAPKVTQVVEGTPDPEAWKGAVRLVRTAK